MMPALTDRDYAVKAFSRGREANPVFGKWAGFHQDEKSGLWFMFTTKKLREEMGPSFKIKLCTKKGTEAVFDLIDSLLSKGVYSKLVLTSLGAETSGNMATAPDFLLADVQEMGASLIRWQMLATDFSKNPGVGPNIRMDMSMRVWALFPIGAHLSVRTRRLHYVHVPGPSRRHVLQKCRERDPSLSHTGWEIRRGQEETPQKDS